MADVLILVESNTTGTGRLFAERARRSGLTPVLMCAAADRYPYVAELGIDVRLVDTSSTAALAAAVAALTAEHRILGVTSSSDYYVAVCAALARSLGLPGEDPARVEAARDKGFQRACFAGLGIASPSFRLVGSAAAAGRAALDIGTPVVVKPVDRSGSLGVRRCDDPAAAVAHAARLLATPFDERGRPLAIRVLVESYLIGPEFSVELLGGQPCAVVGKHVEESRGFLETGHDVPADVASEVRVALATTACAAAAALGLVWGAVHVELRMVGGSPVVVEVNPRLAGGMIPVAIQAATGRDLIGELIALTAGLRSQPGPARSGSASIRFLVPDREGEVLFAPSPSILRGRTGIVAAQVTTSVGRTVALDGSFQDRVGYVVATGADLATARRRAEEAADLLRPRVGEASV